MATSVEEQRKDYQNARKALRAGKVQEFLAIADRLKDYPLYPYLRYSYLQPRVGQVDAGEIQAFFAQYEDFPQADELRAQWLKQLARNKQWQIYFDNYTPQQDVVLQCNFLIARINTGNTSLLLEDIRSIWLSGSSLPPDCNPVFTYLYKSDLMTSELAWQRFRLAMQKNNTGLARHLRQYLDADHQQWANLWLAVHGNPDQETRNPRMEDTPVAREILG
ncbi:MAG: hypothetical protein ACRESK_05760, partial [Gammaproteobacteria bacterium]